MTDVASGYTNHLTFEILLSISTCLYLSMENFSKHYEVREMVPSVHETNTNAYTTDAYESFSTEQNQFNTINKHNNIGDNNDSTRYQRDYSGNIYQRDNSDNTCY
ncbi:unnamed protein product [Cylicocyclus nassatus]|uniref:Uncharacterized protein n=1 Tax=Cylicocyclus nassatus TaxID=53992 RepID=A0AA36GMB0_CYLNA|nr:unnamed protein product [Cylicocyclus nassatus]